MGYWVVWLARMVIGFSYIKLSKDLHESEWGRGSEGKRQGRGLGG